MLYIVFVVIAVFLFKLFAEVRVLRRLLLSPTVPDKQTSSIPMQLERIENILRDIRIDMEDEKMEKLFEKASPLTIEGVRQWKGKHKAWIIEQGYGRPKYRFFQYRHDHINDTVEVMEAPEGLSLDQQLALRRHRRRHNLDEMTGNPPEERIIPANAFGRRQMDSDEHDAKLARLNEGVPEEKQKLWLEDSEQWMPYEFTATKFGSWTKKVSDIRIICG